MFEETYSIFGFSIWKSNILITFASITLHDTEIFRGIFSQAMRKTFLYSMWLLSYKPRNSEEEFKWFNNKWHFFIKIRGKQLFSFSSRSRKVNIRLFAIIIFESSQIFFMIVVWLNIVRDEVTFWYWTQSLSLFLSTSPCLCAVVPVMGLRRVTSDRNKLSICRVFCTPDIDSGDQEKITGSVSPNTGPGFTSQNIIIRTGQITSHHPSSSWS